jgi:undecaprenyl-diphosphatase
MITVRHLPTKKAKALPGSWALTVLFILPSLLIFAFIADKVILESEHYLDQFVFNELAAITNPPLTHLMGVVNFFGSIYFLIPAFILLILFYTVLEKNRVHSGSMAAVGFAGFVVLWALNTVFHHPPPADPIKLSGFSFTGAHPFLVFTFFGLLIYIARQQRTSQLFKWVLSIMLFLIAWTIAVSRVYLHVNYASDVIAGLCLSVIWLGISGWLLSRKRDAPGLLYTL